MPLIQSNLQKAMDQIIAFCGKRTISINETKSFELIFRLHSRKTRVTDATKPIMFLNMSIPLKTTGKFLGILFDQNLSFKQHITQTKSKAQNIATRLNTLHDTKYGPSNGPHVQNICSAYFRVRTYIHHHLKPQHIKTMGNHTNQIPKITIQNTPNPQQPYRKLAKLIANSPWLNTSSRFVSDIFKQSKKSINRFLHLKLLKLISYSPWVKYKYSCLFINRGSGDVRL